MKSSWSRSETFERRPRSFLRRPSDSSPPIVETSPLCCVEMVMSVESRIDSTAVGSVAFLVPRRVRFDLRVLKPPGGDEEREFELLGWCWLVESGERLMFLVEMLESRGSQ